MIAEARRATWHLLSTMTMCAKDEIDERGICPRSRIVHDPGGRFER